jgi:uncharacterized protein (DUF111 family)
VPIVPGAAHSELTTPTGAALVRVLATGFGPMPAMTPVRSGYGAGTRDLWGADGAAIANVLRLTLGVTSVEPGPGDPERNVPVGLAEEPVTVLRTVIDHISAERVAFALERIVAAGALDAWQRPVVMKKGRLGAEVTVLSSPEQARALVAEIVRQTGTLGVRIEPTTRFVAQRDARLVAIDLGEIRLKVGPGDVVRPEHDDIARIARENDMTLADVEARVTEALAATEDADPRGAGTERA